MGFQFDPTGTYSLAASVLNNAGTDALTDVDESETIFAENDIGTRVTDLTGPTAIINNLDQLAYIKVGIVITVILDIIQYPNPNNPARFQYSGVFMKYTLYNVAQPIVQGDRLAG